ncbi:hypothetical protein GCM10010245_36640 [Streptomyces spectabilis]|nr:hypothetical protein GCM10010245_36640 [Streptomyces spectabilis]
MRHLPTFAFASEPPEPEPPVDDDAWDEDDDESLRPESSSPSQAVSERPAATARAAKVSL